MTKRPQPRFTLGQAVRITGTLDKVQRQVTGTRGDYRTQYVPTVIPSAYGRGAVDTGYVIGKRTITDHYLGGGWDEPTTASPVIGTARTAWLVTWDLHRRPVLCLDSQLEPLQPSGLGHQAGTQ